MLSCTFDFWFCREYGIYYNMQEQMAKNIEVDTNLDVKISGLSTKSSTDEMSNHFSSNEELKKAVSNESVPPTLTQRCLYTIFFSNTKSFKKRNSVHVAVVDVFKPQKNSRHQKYSSEEHHKHNDEPDDVILFGPGYISKNCDSLQIKKHHDDNKQEKNVISIADENDIEQQTETQNEIAKITDIESESHTKQ